MNKLRQLTSAAKTLSLTLKNYAIKLNVVMLNVVMQNVVILNDIILSEMIFLCTNKHVNLISARLNFQPMSDS